MGAMGLAGAVRGRTRITTLPSAQVGPADLVDRAFVATRPNLLWVSDVTYVATWSGFAYVAFVVDVFARQIVGWRVARPICSVGNCAKASSEAPVVTTVTVSSGTRTTARPSWRAPAQSCGATGGSTRADRRGPTSLPRPGETAGPAGRRWPAAHGSPSRAASRAARVRCLRAGVGLLLYKDASEHSRPNPRPPGHAPAMTRAQESRAARCEASPVDHATHPMRWRSQLRTHQPCSAELRCWIDAGT